MNVVIVGAGVGGIATAIELRRHGIEDVVLLERAPELGGTWHYNTYPGCACDVPSHLYSFSYAQRLDWSRVCSPQAEIASYVAQVAERFGVAGLVVPNTEVTACAFSDESRRWTVSAADGRTWEADAVVIATGQLHQPALPRFEGASEFAGHSFHSARWDHDYDLRGKRVAVIGTGASAVQFVPEVAEQAARLHVFQRTGNWFLPRTNRPYPTWLKRLVQRVPRLQALRRRYVFHYTEVITLAIRHPRTMGRVGRLWSTIFMRMQLRDPEVRRKAWPDYTFGCKRILFSSHFLPALQRPNVELVTEPIARLSREGIVTADGVERPVDCIIYGTGFRTTEFMFPMEITGRGGRSLREAWAQGPHAHLGIAVPGFPSLFIVYGPNTNTSGGSIIFYEEAQAAYIRQAIAHMRERGVSVEVRPEVESAYDELVQARFAGTAWTDCNSWYRDQSGRIVTNWPGYMGEYADRVRVFDPGEYERLPLPELAPAAA
ncbi:MAG TPA: NAD(P)/FAD-dependent oxidoreductase [Solirubrobacteraceae bacterium]|nr:NAD(P)/FAD-dependent oxidoreductase [Solirubrobacteraceae bacterium]